MGFTLGRPPIQSPQWVKNDAKLNLVDLGRFFQESKKSKQSSRGIATDKLLGYNAKNPEYPTRFYLIEQNGDGINDMVIDRGIIRQRVAR